MKKVFIVIAFILLALPCFAQVDTINYSDNATFLWDAITADANDVPLAPDDVITYEVFILDSSLSVDDQVIENLQAIGTTSDTSMVIPFSDYPRALYWAGVRAVITTGLGAVETSLIAWSYDPVATDPILPFGYIPQTGVLIVPAPSGLRDLGI